MEQPDLTAGLVGHLGIEVLAASGDEVVLRLPVTERLHQPFGLVHGGVHCTLVETAASVGAGLWFGGRGQVVGVANSTDMVRPVREGVLTARGTPVHRGRTQQLWLVEVTDEGGRLVARGQLRVQNLPA